VITIEIEHMLDTRAKTHGEFSDNARVMQGLKNIVRDEPTWTHASYVQREALEMILHKIGRIVTGNPNEPDHWLDIEGYARLARERIAGD
jgi:hypothetical protein